MKAMFQMQARILVQVEELKEMIRKKYDLPDSVEITVSSATPVDCVINYEQHVDMKNLQRGISTLESLAEKNGNGQK